MKSKQEFGDINLSTDNAYQVLNLFADHFHLYLIASVKSQDKTKLRMNSFEKSRGNW